MGWLARWRERREGRKVLASEAHGPDLTPEQREFWETDRSQVDLDRDSIPLNDPNDATSLVFQLALQGHSVMMNQSGPNDEWIVRIDDDPREWVHQHQIIALARALKDVQADDKRGTA